MSIKKIAMAPVYFLDTLLDRFVAVAGAVAAAQFPQFITHYIQRLGGHVDEAARNIAAYIRTAESTGKSLELYIKYLQGSHDSVIAKTGQKIAADLTRYNDLNSALKEITAAPAYKKFFIFIKDIDFEIAGKTWKNFTPGIPFSLEGLVYALAGIVLASLLYLLLKKGIGLLIIKIFKKKKAVSVNSIPGGF